LWFVEYVTNFFHIGKGAGGKKIFKKKKKGGLLNYILFSFLESQNKNKNKNSWPTPKQRRSKWG
jgi:hypothetical protein